MLLLFIVRFILFSDLDECQKCLSLKTFRLCYQKEKGVLLERRDPQSQSRI
jgi:hypothetical protein